MKEIRRTALLERVRGRDPRLIRITAPAGYGKSMLASEISEGYDRVAVCDCLGATEPIDVAKRLLTAIAAWKGDEATTIMMGAACSDNDVAAWTRLAVELWHDETRPALLVIENLESLVGDVALRSPVETLLGRPHGSATVVICAREAVPLRTGRFASPETALAIGYEDLRFSEEEVAVILGENAAAAAAVTELTNGWPMVVQLAARLPAGTPLAHLSQVASSHVFAELYTYLADEVIATLRPQLRSLLEAIAAVPDATAADLKRLQIVDDVESLLAELTSVAPFIRREADGVIRVHPLMQPALEPSAPRRDDLRRSLAERAKADGDTLRAAGLFLLLGDPDACACALEADPLAASPTPDMMDMALALDEETLRRHPLLWCAVVITARGLGYDKQEWLNQADAIWRSLRGDEPLGYRTTAYFTLANAYMNMGRFDEGLRLGDEFAASLNAEELGAMRPVIELWVSCYNGVADRAVDLAEVERVCAPALASNLLRALWTYEIAARVHRVNGARAEERAALETSVQLGLSTRLPIPACAAAMDAAFGAWFAGEDALAMRYAGIVEDNMVPSVQDGCVLMVHALNERFDLVKPMNAKNKVRAYTFTIAAGTVPDPTRAMQFALQAVAAADQSNQPFARIAARVALSCAQPERSHEWLAEAVEISKATDAQRLKRDTKLVARGDATGTMFATLISRFKCKESPAPSREALKFHIMSGILERPEGAVTLTGRELEVMAFLSLRPGPATSDEIADAVWGESHNGDAQTSLKVYISRLRKRLGRYTSIRSSAHGYAIDGAIEVDLVAVDGVLRNIRHAVRAGACDGAELQTLLWWFKRLHAGPVGDLRGRSWLTARLAAIEREVEELALLVAREALKTGNYKDAARIAADIISIDACDEYATEILMRAHAALGEMSAARRVLKTYERALEDEVGVRPSSDLYSILDTTEGRTSALT